jgi:hypothetical protein
VTRPKPDDIAVEGGHVEPERQSTPAISSAA